MSLNKGSLDKANQEQKLDIEYLYRYFTAGENIAAGQIVMLSGVADDTVLIATAAENRSCSGVALTTATTGNLIKICTYGVCEITADGSITSGKPVGIGATPGRGAQINYYPSTAGSAHTHAETLGMGVPSGTLANVPYNAGITFLYAASSSGGSCTTSFYALDAATLGAVADSTHNHTISGAITAESAHTHSVRAGVVIGKAIDTMTPGNTGKIFVCMTG